MNLEILLGGLVGLSLIAVLIYLLTRRETPPNNAASTPEPNQTGFNGDEIGDDDRP